MKTMKYTENVFNEGLNFVCRNLTDRWSYLRRDTLLFERI